MKGVFSVSWLCDFVFWIFPVVRIDYVFVKLATIELKGQRLVINKLTSFRIINECKLGKIQVFILMVWFEESTIWGDGGVECSRMMPMIEDV